jgi:Rod binding domain-containing protein
MLGAISTQNLNALTASSPTAPHFGQSEKNGELREAFDSFVGETFYGQMLKSMRKAQGKPAYFHGGRAEEVFQGQLDQILAEKLTDSSAHNFSDSMFALFQLQRS